MLVNTAILLTYMNTVDVPKSCIYILYTFWNHCIEMIVLNLLGIYYTVRDCLLSASYSREIGGRSADKAYWNHCGWDMASKEAKSLE